MSLENNYLPDVYFASIAVDHVLRDVHLRGTVQHVPLAEQAADLVERGFFQEIIRRLGGADRR